MLAAVALFSVVPLASAQAQGCEKKGTCEAPSENESGPKEDPHPDKGNPSPGTPPEEPPGNPNPGNKDPSGATEPPSSGGGTGGGTSPTDGGSSPTDGGGGSAEEPSSSGSGGGGHSGGGTVQPTGDDERGTAPTAREPRERNVPNVEPTRGPRHVVFRPVDGVEPGRQFLGGRDVLDVVANASHVAAFPLFLALIVGVFLLVQDRIDRKDPKLADAAKTKDYLIFD